MAGPVDGRPKARPTGTDAAGPMAWTTRPDARPARARTAGPDTGTAMGSPGSDLDDEVLALMREGGALQGAGRHGCRGQEASRQSREPHGDGDASRETTTN